jgi:hypothetical protein
MTGNGAGCSKGLDREFSKNPEDSREKEKRGKWISDKKPCPFSSRYSKDLLDT